jgi:hypothetical protein
MLSYKQKMKTTKKSAKPKKGGHEEKVARNDAIKKAINMGASTRDVGSKYNISNTINGA